MRRASFVGSPGRPRSLFASSQPPKPTSSISSARQRLVAPLSAKPHNSPPPTPSSPPHHHVKYSNRQSRYPTSPYLTPITSPQATPPTPLNLPRNLTFAGADSHPGPLLQHPKPLLKLPKPAAPNPETHSPASHPTLRLPTLPRLPANPLNIPRPIPSYPRPTPPTRPRLNINLAYRSPRSLKPYHRRRWRQCFLNRRKPPSPIRLPQPNLIIKPTPILRPMKLEIDRPCPCRK